MASGCSSTTRRPLHTSGHRTHTHSHFHGPVLRHLLERHHASLRGQSLNPNHLPLPQQLNALRRRSVSNIAVAICPPRVCSWSCSILYPPTVLLCLCPILRLSSITLPPLFRLTYQTHKHPLRLRLPGLSLMTCYFRSSKGFVLQNRTTVDFYLAHGRYC